MLQKSITFIVLLLFVYGILEFDASNPYSTANTISYISFVIFIAYLIYSLKQASANQKKNGDF